MWCYIVAIVLFVLAYNYDFQENTKGKHASYWLVCLLLICIAGFRYRLGIDTLSYQATFEDNFPSLNQFWDVWRAGQLPYEFGYSLFTSIFKTLFDNWFVLQFAIALCTNLSFFCFFKKNTIYPFTAVFFYFCIYYFDSNFETLRQAMSMSIFLFAFEYLKERRYVPYYTLCIVALLFHNIAVVFFFIPLMRFKFSYKLVAVVTLCCLFLSSIVISFFGWILDIFQTYGTDLMADKANTYITGDVWGVNEQRISARSYKYYIFYLLLYIFPILCLSFVVEKTGITDKKNYYSPFILIWSIAISMRSVLPVMYRVQELMLPVIFILLAESVVRTIQSGKFMKTCLISYAIVVMLFYWNYVRFYQVQEFNHTRPRIVSCTPYSNCFTKEVDTEREFFYREVGAK